MSNVDKNNTGLNYAFDEKGNVSRADNQQYRSKNSNEEFASEFVTDATLENANNYIDQSGNKFEPNKEKTVSERSAWH